MKRMTKGQVRRIRLRAAVAYPSVTVALVGVVALALTSFGPSQVTALAATTGPLTATATLTVDPTATATPTVDPTATATTVPGTVASPTPGLGVSPGAPFSDHHVVARIEGPAGPVNYLPIDAAVSDASRFQTFRLRFRLNNAGTEPITATPRLEYRPEGASSYIVVPDKPQLGIAFNVDREWVPSGGGTVQGPLGENIAVAGFRMGTEGGLAMTGHHSMGVNPDRPITLATSSYTEEEFTVTISTDAQYLTGYQLRVTDAGAPLTADVATIRLGVQPAAQLSPGQRQGVAVVDPKVTNAAAAAYPLLSTASKPAAGTPLTAIPAVSRPSTQSYPLVVATPNVAAVAGEGIHGPYTLTTGKCGDCHRAHATQAPNLLVKSSQSGLCLACHNGSAASANVQLDYPAAPPNVNNPVTREYYSHDALAPSNHTRSGLDEFGGVSNRHSECADCHNSHKAQAAPDSTETSDLAGKGTGWAASGRLAGVSGVSVENGPAGSAPAYTFLSGVTDTVNDEDPVTNTSPITLEYQLCFKCHSGFTKLPSNATLENSTPPQPSKYALDKGIEFNPANPSFHPVEAGGKNTSLAMEASLAGTSPSKLWNFTVGSTIRCLNCHASGSTDTTTDPTLTAPGASLAPHSSSNRGILLKNYRDRLLKPAGEGYLQNDFALCYVCHAEEPFVAGGTASKKTNFSEHSRHLNLLSLKGNGLTSIDTPGGGQGNAICAECHFRTHSTTNDVDGVGGSRLVRFAPDVLPNVGGTAISWNPGTTGGGSCTLTCHGVPHANAPYSPSAP